MLLDGYILKNEDDDSLYMLRIIKDKSISDKVLAQLIKVDIKDN